MLHPISILKDAGLSMWIWSTFTQTCRQRFNSGLSLFFDGTGSLLPLGREIALSRINSIHSLWAFFTRQEIDEMAPVIMAAIEDPKKQVLYKEEWRDLLVAHQRYNLATRTNFTYDWVALFAMY